MALLVYGDEHRELFVSVASDKLFHNLQHLRARDFRRSFTRNPAAVLS
jgi:hypothetical protein